MFEALKAVINTILSDTQLNSTEKMQQICHTLRNQIAYYDWVGFYFKNGDKRELKLRAFSGKPTDHTIIPFGKGICGQVAESNTNFVAPDVQQQNNYIACSLSVKSEIVVPLFKNGKNIGQIDIDSNTLNSFTEADERFLEWLNREVAKVL